MSTAGEFIIHTDGGARGNPGPAAYGIVLERPGASDVEEKGFLGHTTNNIAEYQALVRALELARELGGRRLVINSDSELMVKQMNGAYKVKNEGLLPLYRKARDLVEEFDHVTLKHIRRERNSRADALANEAMDNPHEHTPVRTSSPPAPKKQDPRERARAAGLAFLKEQARLWARGNADDPDPAQTLEELCKILRDQC